MHPWPFHPWRAEIRRKGEPRIVELDSPVALIGSHPECHVQLDSSGVPSVAYVAVAYGSRVEVWPVCPLAFAIWGRVNETNEMLIGRTRVVLVQEGPGDADENPDSFLWSPASDLILDWGEGEKRKTLTRSVSILGQDHPSIIRLHGTGLERCDHAVICFSTRVWMVDLHPDRVGGRPEPEEIVPGELSRVLGGIHFWNAARGRRRRKKRVKSVLPEPREPMAVAVRKKPAAESPAVHLEIGRGNDAPQLPAAEVRKVEPEIQAKGNARERLPAPDRQNRSAGELPRENEISVVTRVGEETRLARRPDNVDELTEEWTERLLETTEKRWWKRRMVKWGVLALLGLISVGVVGGILIGGVLPMLRSIYSE